jgi:excisionase family DNA binding protein
MARIDTNQIFENLPKKDFLTCIEVAEYFRVHKSTVMRWVARDEIPYVKISGRLLFSTARIKEMALKRGA